MERIEIELYKEHDLHQGSDEWHSFRLNHFGASELAAAMGLSKKVTRTELLDAKSTGIAREFSSWVQKNILDAGHEIEASARPIVARIIGKKLYPSTYSLGKISASVDGLTADGSTAWEHKQYNKEYFEIVMSGVVPEEHMPQCQQVLMVTGADVLKFTISDGTEDLMVHVDVYPDSEWFERIKATWAQFEIDLAKHVPVHIAEKPIADAITDLPALFVQAKGEITAHNMEEFGRMLAISLAETRAIVLTTDQDYSNAEAAAKMYRKQCKKLVLVKDAVLAQATTIGEATRMIDAWHEDLRVTALQLENDVKDKKETKKLEIITEARIAYIDHIAALEDEIKPIRLNLDVPDFADAMKGKRLIKAWHNEVNTLLAISKINADAAAKDVREKLNWCKESSSGFGFLFNDLAQIITKQLEDFKLVVTTRIEAHKVAEAEKRDAEREQMRIEEEAKAKAKADAEAQASIQAALAAQREIDAAEAKAKRIQEGLEAAKSWRVNNEAEQAKIENKPSSVYSGGAEVSFSTAKVAAQDEVRSEVVAKLIDAAAPKTITISMDEYNSLKEDSELLNCLRACGVDNWEGWDDAIEMAGAPLVD